MFSDHLTERSGSLRGEVDLFYVDGTDLHAPPIPISPEAESEYSFDRDLNRLVFSIYYGPNKGLYSFEVP